MSETAKGDYRVRVSSLVKKITDIFEYRGYLKRAPGKDVSTALGIGLVVRYWYRIIGRYLDADIEPSEAKAQIDQELGKEDATFVAELEKTVESFFNPTTFFKDLLRMFVKDSEFQTKIQRDPETVSLVHSLSKALKEKA
mgnify:CR=1 FL=1